MAADLWAHRVATDPSDLIQVSSGGGSMGSSSGYGSIGFDTGKEWQLI